MRALPEHERTDNTNADRRNRKRCGACADSGWAEVNHRVDTHNDQSASVEEYGPCPFCARGLAYEFPTIPALPEKARAMIPTPWGSDGYWQGRELPEHMVAHWVETGRPVQHLSIIQQRAELAKLIASVRLTTVDSGIEPRRRARPPLVTDETADWASTYTFEPEPAETAETVGEESKGETNAA